MSPVLEDDAVEDVLLGQRGDLHDPSHLLAVAGEDRLVGPDVAP